MKFSLPKSFEILERTPAVIRHLLSDLSEDWTHSNEGENTWSAFDIVGHLIHGEKTDWMARVNIILAGGSKPFEPFDRFAQFRDSEGKSLSELTNTFAQLRKENLAALRNLDLHVIDLERVGLHPAFGEVTLSELLATWVVHDLGHLAQITRVMAKQYRSEVGPWEEYLPVLKR